MKCWHVLGLGAFLLLGAGCATTNERRVLLERASAEVAYALPPEQVMDAARAVLKDRGYLLAPSRSPHTLRTLWKIAGDFDMTARWSLLLVTCQQRADGRFILLTQQATYVTGGRTAPHPGSASSVSGGVKRGNEGTTNYYAGDPYSSAKPVFSRALDIEWEILQRLDPQTAAEMEEQVDIYLSNPH
ncbi:MAG: hypothetical protein JXB05_06735 [Myxococcaceae bacterium]|nr:hypothetical protein [Myxococcaceae bacterium]